MPLTDVSNVFCEACFSTCEHFSSMMQAVPEWARGVFSVRFGGSEFKDPAAAQTSSGQAGSGATSPTVISSQPINGIHPDKVHGSDKPLANGGANTSGKLPTFTGSPVRVYGNSSRETGHTAQEHCAAGLPVWAQDHPSSAVLWITGKLRLEPSPLQVTVVNTKQ
jgi:hypothetical protein